MLYNYGASILRAVGDTKRPLFFLIIAGIVNAGLNMCLVIIFHLGVAGVAIGTVISQLISSVLVLVTDKLPVAVFEIKDQRRVFKTDISGWNSGRNPEYSY